jgi:hypothetical protein
MKPNDKGWNWKKINKKTKKIIIKKIKIKFDTKNKWKYNFIFWQREKKE